MTDMADIEIRKDEQRSRYEAVVDGQVAGYAEYRDRGEAIQLPHTVVEDEREEPVGLLGRRAEGPRRRAEQPERVDPGVGRDARQTQPTTGQRPEGVELSVLLRALDHDLSLPRA